MPTHDCSKCPGKGQCPIEEIAPWLNEHEGEIITALGELREGLAQACCVVAAGIPLPIYDKRAIAEGVKAAALLGYHKGRMWQDVPEAFKKE